MRWIVSIEVSHDEVAAVVSYDVVDKGEKSSIACRSRPVFNLKKSRVVRGTFGAEVDGWH